MDITPTTTNSADTDTTTSQTTPLPLQTHLKNALSLVTPTNHLPPPQLGGGGGGEEEEEFFTNSSYRECLKNHAASLGGLALDGCGEFMPTPNASPSDPTSLKCAACGCHRNFHRRHRSLTTPHLPPPLHYTSSSPSSSPTPHQSIFPSAPPPHLLLPLSTALSGPFDLEENHPHRNHQHRGIFNFNPTVMNPLGKKRARTKFTEQQKLKMYAFAEKLGWKMPRGSDEKMVEDFCHDVGVERNVFKVWMHNNKSRREKSLNFASNINGGNNNNGDDDDDDDVKEGILSNYGNVVNASNFNNFHRFRIESKVRVPISADGSSPSSS